MLVGTIDFYYLLPLSMTLTLAGSSKVSAKQNLLASFSGTLLNQSGWNLIWCWSGWSWTSWYYVLVRFLETIEIHTVLLTASKYLNRVRHLDVYKSSMVQNWFDDRYYWSLHSDTSLTDLDSRSQECEKAKTSAPIISQSFQIIWMKFGLLLRFVHLMNFMLTLFWPFSIQWRVPSLCDFVFKKHFKIGLYSDIYIPISFKLGMMIRISKLYILVSVWMSLTFIQGHSCMRNQKLVCPFSQKLLLLIWMKFSLLPQPIALLKLMLYLFCTSNIQERVLCWCDLINYKYCPLSWHLWTDLFDARHD